MASDTVGSIAAVHAILNVGGDDNPVRDRTLVRQLFERYDADHNGKLDKEELTALLHDAFLLGIERSEGRKESWREQGRMHLESEFGKKMVSEAVGELLSLRDSNQDGVLSWEEFTSALDSESSRHDASGRFWRLAPLADVPIDFERLANGPHFKLKVFVAGAFAGMTAKTVASPLARLTILLQTGGITGAAKDPVGLARHIVHKEGVKGLFRGNAADILRQIPYSGICYLMYEELKGHVQQYDSSSSKLGTRLLCGGLAGSCAIASTYPLDLVRARLCVQTTGRERYRGIVHALKVVHREEGIRGMYKGCGTAVAERFPNMAINFGSYEWLRSAFASQGYTGLGPSAVCGCAAGWAGTVVTFPVDVVMRNLQVGGTGARGAAYSGPAECARQLYQHGGMRAFYQGIGPQLAKAIPMSTATWAAYDLARRILHFEVK